MILRCDALLFDLDGVLVDSATCVEATWRRWALLHALDPIAVIAAAHGRCAIDTIRRVAPHLADEEEVTALAASEATTTEGVCEVPRARSLLARFPPHRWAVVTSGIQSVAWVTSPMRTVSGLSPRIVWWLRMLPPDWKCRDAGMRSIGIAGTYAFDALHAATFCVGTLDMLEITSASHAVPIELRFPPT